MSFSISAFTQSSFGRFAYRPIQKLIHRARLRAHPEVPLEDEVIEVPFGERKISIERRRWNTSDAMAVDRCFTDGQYDMRSGVHGAYMERVYRAIVAAGKKPLIVDCGANIGASVLWFHARYPEAHIVAVEPAPDNFAILRRNCRGLDVDLRQAGIGCADGTAWLTDRYGASMGYRTNEQREGLEIQIQSLETLMTSKPASDFGPFLLKVDVEGAEKSLFQADAAALDQFPVIIMEPHDWLLPGQGTSLEFFRFHAQAARDFVMKDENVVSIKYNPDLFG